MKKKEKKTLLGKIKSLLKDLYIQTYLAMLTIFTFISWAVIAVYIDAPSPQDIINKYERIIHSTARPRVALRENSSFIGQIEVEYLFILLIIVISATIFIAYNTVKLGKEDLRVKEEYPDLSIITIMKAKKEKQNFYAIVIFSLSMISYVLFFFLRNKSIPELPLKIISIGLLLSFIQDKIIAYRFRSGFYGNNEEEAREIIKFIMKNSDTIDFTDGGKNKKIFDDQMKEFYTHYNSLNTVSSDKFHEI